MFVVNYRRKFGLLEESRRNGKTDDEASRYGSLRVYFCTRYSAGRLASRQSAFFVGSFRRNARQPLNLVDAVAFPLRGWNAPLHEASESPPPRERSVHLAARVDDDLTDRRLKPKRAYEPERSSLIARARARERSRSARRPMVIGEAKRRRRRDARSSSSSSLGQPGPSLAVVAKTFPLALLFGR